MIRARIIKDRNGWIKRLKDASETMKHHQETIEEASTNVALMELYVSACDALLLGLEGEDEELGVPYKEDFHHKEFDRLCSNCGGSWGCDHTGRDCIHGGTEFEDSGRYITEGSL